MKSWNMSLIAGLAASVTATSPALAQSNREAAVAIDRVRVPPSDRFEIEQIGPPLAAPWSLAFLPDGSFLVSEKHGGLRRIAAGGKASPAMAGGPPGVFAKSDSGLHDVVLDPDFASNRFVYLAFVQGTEESNRTAIWKARLDGDRLTSGRVIFRANQDKKAPSHPGGRLLFLPDKSLLLGIGDGYDYRDKAQDPASHLGKVVRVDREGAALPDNPFVGRPGYAPEIWTMGHRNIQGLSRDPATGTVWAHEHGPRGGDEINELVAGRNYGWPRASFGIDYDGKLITDRQHVAGLADPRFVWSPSIAPSGLAIYRGALFPDWAGRLLTGGLASRNLVQVRVNENNGLLAEEGRWLTGLKERIRDVRVAPDGNIYLLTDANPGRLLRLVPPTAALAIGGEHRLAPLSFLLGSWTGQSRFVPAFTANPKASVETSQIDCEPRLKATYIACTIRFTRDDGRTRIVEHHITRGATDPAFNFTVFDSGWAGKTSYTMLRDEAAQAFVGTIPTDSNGRPATERIMVTPSADRQSLVHTEAIRLDATPAAPWTETFRWTWTRRKP